LVCTLALLAIAAAGCRPRTAELTVRVMDVEGNPLPGAMVSLTEQGQTLMADEQGQVTWMDLEDERASLVVVAPGYILRSKKVDLERGANDTVVALEKRDVPIQLEDS